MKSNFLVSSWLPMEIHTYSSHMLEALDSYTDDEVASIPSFLEIYTDLVILVAKKKISFHEETHIAIEILESKQKRIDKAYKAKLIKSSTYRRFYYTLTEYYMKNGDDVKYANVIHEFLIPMVNWNNAFQIVTISAYLLPILILEIDCKHFTSEN